MSIAINNRIVKINERHGRIPKLRKEAVYVVLNEHCGIGHIHYKVEYFIHLGINPAQIVGRFKVKSLHPKVTYSQRVLAIQNKYKSIGNGNKL